MARTKYTNQGSLAAGLAVAALSLTIMAQPSTARAQSGVESETVHQENLSAESIATHHYASPAERAQDALLIVEVKTAIAHEGLADDYPLTVDADHIIDSALEGSATTTLSAPCWIAWKTCCGGNRH